jgi:hypothetical protein
MPPEEIGKDLSGDLPERLSEEDIEQLEILLINHAAFERWCEDNDPED